MTMQCLPLLQCKGCQGCNGKGSNGQAEAHERSTANGDSAEARQQAEELEVLRAKLAGTKELELAEEVRADQSSSLACFVADSVASARHS